MLPTSRLRAAWRALASDHLRVALLALVGMSALATVFVFARESHTGRTSYNFLLWNLFLAWVPALLALAADLAWRRWRRVWLPLPLALGWLAFFPNGPYIVTDLMHLRTTFWAPLWFDLMMVATAACAGLFLGLVSLAMVHRLAREVTGSRVVGWAVAVLACLLGGFGVFLGRFQRWNTWDIVTRPGALFEDAFTSVADSRGIGFSLGFGLLLLSSYLVVKALGRGPAPGAEKIGE